MRKNVIKFWNPIDEILDKPYVDSINLDENLSFRIKDEKNLDVNISFENFISYRVIDEGFLIDLWDSNSDLENLNNLFYTIENSEYVDFFKKMSKGMYKDWDVYHYAIYTENDCFDILTRQKPIVN